ncbi:hypothetical protein [Photobacterium galatheae]|uniref:Uncharacterized protein n=1 Tax=Photobacterium galatheae TaxID=1654360 RepID=A0A066RLQ7_9GAMM|nr:hypothetical protein [Photobacterium galatheae]KDM91269.1 hypothetical protein EA58_11890 [Photobacterium galatheae]MCM0150332.1 hypothetical protein [Photobacterium galatheae]
MDKTPQTSRLAGKIGMFAIAIAMMGNCHSALAYLGGFEDNDGYVNDYLEPTTTFPEFNDYVVNNYNAGLYGTANGGPGGGPMTIMLNSGRWMDLNGHPNDDYHGGNYIIAHAVTPVTLAHSGTAMLGMRTISGSSGFPNFDIDFAYFLDERDFYNGGTPVTPTDTTNHIVDWSIWACGDERTPPVGTTEKFYWTFTDGNGNIGGQVGWDDANGLLYRTSVVDPWTSVAFTVDPAAYDRFDFSFNTLDDTWSLSIFDSSSTSTLNVFTNLAMGMSMDYFARIDWHMGTGVFKNFFDDSAFTITELEVPNPVSAPASFGLLLLGSAGLMWRHRRSSSKVN